MFSKKATKIDKIFTVDLTLFSKCQINSEDFVNFCGLLRKHELYVLTNFPFITANQAALHYTALPASDWDVKKNAL